jgi:hypothetical protein
MRTTPKFAVSQREEGEALSWRTLTRCEQALGVRIKSGPRSSSGTLRRGHLRIYFIVSVDRSNTCTFKVEGTGVPESFDAEAASKGTNVVPVELDLLPLLSGRYKRAP